jgi:hypothetical protein
MRKEQCMKNHFPIFQKKITSDCLSLFQSLLICERRGTAEQQNSRTAEKNPTL